MNICGSNTLHRKQNVAKKANIFEQQSSTTLLNIAKKRAQIGEVLGSARYNVLICKIISIPLKTNDITFTYVMPQF